MAQSKSLAAYIPYFKSNYRNVTDIQYQNGGSVYVWGRSSNGGFSPITDNFGPIAGLSNVKAVYSTSGAYAALLTDGTVYIWGDSQYGGSNVFGDPTKYGYLMIDGQKVQGVKTIRSTIASFAALLENGTVCIWGGDQTYGGANAPEILNNFTNIKAIYSNERAFAAIKTDGTVWAWGNTNYGGFVSPSQVTGVSNVVSISVKVNGFVAVTNDGSVYVWGSVAIEGYIEGLKVKNVVSNNLAFAAITTDNTVYIWDNIGNGGSTDGTSATTNIEIPGLNNVVSITPSEGAFSAQTSNGIVYVWGNPLNGGSIDPSDIITYNPGVLTSIGIGVSVVKSYSNGVCFAYITSDGRVFCNGQNTTVGNGNVSAYIPGAEGASDISNTYSGFTALLPGNLLYSWGLNQDGTSITNPGYTDISTVYSNNDVFSTILLNKTVKVWTDNTFNSGGDPAQVTAITDATTIYSNPVSFAALIGASDPIDINNPPVPPTPSTEPDTSLKTILGVLSLIMLIVGGILLIVRYNLETIITGVVGVIAGIVLGIYYFIV